MRDTGSIVFSRPSVHSILFALTFLGGLFVPPAALAQRLPPDAFDGSFRLATGEVVTGGYFVEDGEGRFLYMDTRELVRGGLFERVGEALLRSVVPADTVEIEFLPAADGAVDELVWRPRDGEPVRGVRVYPHDSRPIHFVSEDGTELHGRLLLPRCSPPHPAVVSVHGSGPVDRHGGPYHTFFFQHGVAVLAYDKRGYASATESWREPDLATLSADAAAALRFAAALPELDAERVGYFGSSQAGWVVPRAAVEAAATDFMILRAGAGLDHMATVLHEVRQELRAEGLHGLELDHAMDLRREVYALARAGEPLAATDPLVAPYLAEPWYRAAFGEGPISHRWSTQRWAWIRRNFGVAATPHLRRFDGPVLWFLAERDENVPLVATRAALERALRAAPGGDHEIEVLEGARHSFLIHEPDRPPRFSRGFFTHMEEWMRRRGIADRRCWAAEREAAGPTEASSAPRSTLRP